MIYFFRMDGWASDLDLTFKRLTNGETDITGASQLEYVREYTRVCLHHNVPMSSLKK